MYPPVIFFHLVNAIIIPMKNIVNKNELDFTIFFHNLLIVMIKFLSGDIDSFLSVIQ